MPIMKTRSPEVLPDKPRRARYCVNLFEFEGWVGSVRRIETKKGRRITGVDLVDRLPARKRPGGGYPTWVRTASYDDLADKLLDVLRPGHRLLVRGNFYNPPKGRWGFVMRLVATEARLLSETVEPRGINSWQFEGTMARDPREDVKADRPVTKVGIWQPGVALRPVAAAPGVMIPRMSRPIILNPMAFGDIGEQVQEFHKGDDVFFRGYFACFRRNGATCPIIDRAFPVPGDWMDKRVMRKKAEARQPPKQNPLGWLEGGGVFEL